MINLNSYRKPLLGGVILVLGGWHALSQWSASGKPAAARGADAAAMPEAADADLRRNSAAAVFAEMRRRQAEWAAAAWPANPFNRLSSAAQKTAAAPPARPADNIGTTASETWTLTAILSGNPPLALINGQIVKTGDFLTDNLYVFSITAKAVALQGPEGTRILQLAE